MKKLANDCFALPPGVDWTPVDEALARLRDGLTCIAGAETVPVGQADGRILAEAAVAARSNPPYANSAVDGYGFAADSLPGGAEISLPLMQGRAAAGVPFEGSLPAGQALRILTGAMLPEGVDTVLLQEDAEVDGAVLRFAAGLKPFANTRKAGEDVLEGVEVLPAGHRLRPADLALLTALGCSTVSVRTPLRIGVMSTGDELVQAGEVPLAHQIFDANRPMLSALIGRWGFDLVDLGQAPDRAEAVTGMLADAATRCDAILTSGGASAGDEDHVSAALKAHGAIETWRIAVKPGRPLALGVWDGTPVFGLPGNPVAAFVCALIFVRPALCLMSGQGWCEATAQTLPAAFAKSKKPGRREYLRARRVAGGVEVFQSEGSGRISGLSWADGLVELPDDALDVQPGMPVRFLPYEGFGI
ncbi:molybdenum cofactor synthesis domain-containing protein [Halovulum sp. GXIMD14793]